MKPTLQLVSNKKKTTTRDMKSLQALRVLRGYRRALRATEKVFAGDENIEVARSYVRDQFRARVDETDRDLIGTGEKICSHTHKHSSNTHTHTTR